MAKESKSSLTPRAIRLIDQLTDLDQTLAGLSSAEKPPTDAQIGKEIFSRTIAEQSSSGTIYFDPALLSTFSYAEIKRYADAIEAGGGRVKAGVTAWQLESPVIQTLIATVPLRMVAYWTLPLQKQPASYAEKRGAIKERLQKGAQHLEEDLEQILGEKSEWITSLATSVSVRFFAQAFFSSTDLTLQRPQ